MQGYFGGRVDLVFQRFLEIWSSIPSLFVLIIISSVLVPGFWTLLGVLLLFHWVYLVGVVRAEFLRGRNFEYITAARALGLSNAKIMFKHLLPNAMVATLTFLPFKLSGSITALTALDFLGLRPAARLAVARRAAGAGQGQPAGALARPRRLRLDRRPAVSLLDLRRRGACATRSTRARRSGEGTSMASSPRSSTSATCRCAFRSGGRDRHAVKRRLVHDRQGRDGGAGRRVRLRQDRLGAVDHAAAALPAASHPTGEICSTARTCSSVGEPRCARSAASRSPSSSRSR